MFWYHQNQQGFNNLPLFDDDKTPYQRNKAMISIINLKLPLNICIIKNKKLGRVSFEKQGNSLKNKHTTMHQFEQKHSQISTISIIIHKPKK